MLSRIFFIFRARPYEVSRRCRASHAHPDPPPGPDCNAPLTKKAQCECYQTDLSIRGNVETIHLH